MGVKDAEGPFLGFHALKHPGVPATNDLAGTLGVGAREDLLAQMIALESQLSAIELQQATHFMEAIRMSAESAECPSVAMIQRYGDLSDLLTDFENDTRLIVMGRRGKAHEGFRDAIGSHIERVIRKFHKPVLVVAEDFVVPKQFMIAFDGSQAGRKVFDLVANSSLMRERRCHLAIVDGDAGVIEGASNLSLRVAMRCGRLNFQVPLYQHW